MDSAQEDYNPLENWFEEEENRQLCGFLSVSFPGGPVSGGLHDEPKSLTSGAVSIFVVSTGE